MGVYYCTPVKKSCCPLHKPVTAKEKLVNHCRNILFRSGDTNPQRRKRGAEDESFIDAVVPKKKHLFGFRR